MSGIRAVVFDLGRVMIQLAPGWEHACRASGVPYRPFAETPDYRDRLDVLERDYGCGRVTPDEYFAELLVLSAGLYTPAELRTLHQAVIQPEYAGIAERVGALKAAGCFTACLSNTCASHWDALVNPACYPGIGRLDARFASHLWGLMKPDPAIYQRFEAETGFHGNEILFFDDLAANVDAARALGWHAVRITRTDTSLPEITAALAAHGVPVTP